MKIYSPIRGSLPQTKYSDDLAKNERQASGKRSINKKQKLRTPKQNLSAAEIRARVQVLAQGKKPKKSAATNVELSKEAKDLASNNSNQDGPEDNVMKENNPSGSNVYEKLRKSMDTGSFSFSDKEKQVLEDILSSNS